MSDRRYRPANKWRCKPTEDVCVQHDRELQCRHGCAEAKLHQCIDAKRENRTHNPPPQHVE
jgi:hypothetical protein